jgi:hypothetical protein
MEKPNKALYGYEDAGRGDDGEGGWIIEGGEQSYYDALSDYEKSKNVPDDIEESKRGAFESLKPSIDKMIAEF